MSRQVNNGADWMRDTDRRILRLERRAGGTGAGGGTAGPPGPAGPTGPTGATGPTGPAGPSGAAGAPGSTWFTGSGAPAAGTGINGDFYLNAANGDVYHKVSGSWSVTGNIRGPQGAAGATGGVGPQGPQGIQGIQGVPGTNGEKWSTGAGAPAAGVGATGDLYLNTTNGDVYDKASGSWVLVGNIKGPQGAQGPQGIQGNQGIQGVAGTPGEKWFTGSGVPAAGTGATGDLYLDVATGDVYDKASGAWVKVGNIKGKPGTVTYNGNGAPVSQGAAVTGDYYLDNLTGDLYQWQTPPGAWVKISNIKGPPGAGGSDNQLLNPSFENWTGAGTSSDPNKPDGDIINWSLFWGQVGGNRGPVRKGPGRDITSARWEAATGQPATLNQVWLSSDLVVLGGQTWYFSIYVKVVDPAKPVTIDVQHLTGPTANPQPFGSGVSPTQVIPPTVITSTDYVLLEGQAVVPAPDKYGKMLIRLTAPLGGEVVDIDLAVAKNLTPPAGSLAPYPSYSTLSGLPGTAKGNSAYYAFPWPGRNDIPDVPTDIQNLAVAVDAAMRSNQSHGDNLLANPGFEAWSSVLQPPVWPDGKPLSWSTTFFSGPSGVVRKASSVRLGQFAAEFAAIVAGAAAQVFIGQDDIAVSPGDVVYMGAWVRSPDAAKPGQIDMTLLSSPTPGPSPGGSGVHGTVALPVISVPGTAWTYYEGSAQVPAGDLYARAMFRLTAPIGTNQVVQIDEAYAKKITPSGASLPYALKTFTPTWTSGTGNPSLGNGSILGEYVVLGDICYVRIQLQWGSTTTGGSGSWTFGLPPGAPILAGGVRHILQANMRTATTFPMAGEISGSAIVFRLGATHGGADSGFTSYSHGNAVPAAPANGTIIMIDGWYRCAPGSS